MQDADNIIEDQLTKWSTNSVNKYNNYNSINTIDVNSLLPFPSVPTTTSTPTYSTSHPFIPSSLYKVNEYKEESIETYSHKGSEGDSEYEVCQNWQELYDLGIDMIKTDPKQIYVTKGVIKTLKRYMKLSKKELDQAVVILSLLWKPRSEGSKDTPLAHNQLLRPLFGQGNETKVLKKLIKGTDKGPIVEQVKEFNSHLGICRTYRVSEKYRKRGHDIYTITNKELLKNLEKMRKKYIDDTYLNDIAFFNIASYSKITLPTTEEIWEAADELVNEGKTHKGKKYSYRPDRASRENHDKYIYIEDTIETYERLTQLGYMVPKASENAGGRVADSFTLMPRWIRNLCKMDGKPMIENDFTALHPNIILKHYSNFVGHDEYQKIKNVINKYNGDLHQYMADKTGLDRSEVKTYHLSIFNMRPSQLEKNYLWNIWKQEFPECAREIIKDKQDYYYDNGEYNKDAYKNTTKLLFEEETKIMSNLIEILKQDDINGIYVYDAIYSLNDISHYMQEVTNQMGYTNLK